MAYRYLDDLTLADVAFEASGRDLSQLFASAWEALLGVMIVDPAGLAAAHRRLLSLREESLETLLHSFLECLLYYRDAEGLLLRTETVDVDGGACGVHAELVGDEADPARHTLGTDVKAVTWHHFSLTIGPSVCTATVVLDV